ncbi:MAG: dephospho-CoA kinase [Defluviitaleaceae bacterium]|nr:dephospho-CoA kinase [Defluviitaleaceae bacterium]
MTQSKIIGLTGRSGSGKGVVSSIIEEYCAKIIDCDKIVHELFRFDKNLKSELYNFFGCEIFDDNNYINRKKLGSIVFASKEKLDFLTKTTHRYVVKKVEEIIKESSEYKYIVIDAPLLVEAGLHKISDTVWLVFASEEISLKRIVERDGISYENAKKRLDNQKSFEELKSYANVIIKNEKSVEELRIEIEEKIKQVF